MVTEEALKRELGPGNDWMAPLPPNPSPAEELTSWCKDVQTVHDAAARVRERMRAVQARWHRERLVELEGAAS